MIAGRKLIVGFNNEKFENTFGKWFPYEPFSNCYFYLRKRERLISPSLLSTCLSPDPKTFEQDTFHISVLEKGDLWFGAEGYTYETVNLDPCVTVECYFCTPK